MAERRTRPIRVRLPKRPRSNVTGRSFGGSFTTKDDRFNIIAGQAPKNATASQLADAARYRSMQQGATALVFGGRGVLGVTRRILRGGNPVTGPSLGGRVSSVVATPVGASLPRRRKPAHPTPRRDVRRFLGGVG